MRTGLYAHIFLIGRRLRRPRGHHSASVHKISGMDFSINRPTGHAQSWEVGACVGLESPEHNYIAQKIGGLLFGMDPQIHNAC